MESDNENNGLGIDWSHGALVWVRRRNGSWWPGRVLGPDELLGDCLNPLRSGTPIKLLGRADGSLDWYNLEKSKRVKAFRCGEYDECIEKVKNRVMRSKRKASNLGKYVRREDAILHALELEEAYASDGNQKFGSGNNCLTVKEDKHLGPQPNGIGHNKDQVNGARKASKNKKLSQKLLLSGISFEHPREQPSRHGHYMQKKRWRTPYDSEDDTSKGMKRMRDLQDLGFGKILNREPNGRAQIKGLHDLALSDSASLGESDFDNDLSGDTPINSSRDSCSSLKRKQPHASQACDSLKKKCRRRSLAAGWMGARKVKIPSLGHQGAISEESSLQGLTNLKLRVDNSTSNKKDAASALSDSPNRSGTSCEEALLNTHEKTDNAACDGTNFPAGTKDSLFSDILEFIDNDISDVFIDVPVMAGENTADRHLTFKTCLSEKPSIGTEADQSNQCMQIGLVSRVNEGLGEACSTSSSTQANDTRQKIDTGASEWHTKGKRNARHPTLNKHVDSNIVVGRKGQPDPCLASRNTLDETANSTSEELLTSDGSCQQTQCLSISEVRDVTGDQKPKISWNNAGKQNFDGENRLVSAADGANACRSGPRDIESGELPSNEVINPTLSIHAPLPPRKIRLPSRYRDSEENSSRLYDVEVTVQSNYQGQRVPLVSLRSKFNGKAIVGHPVTVEILERGTGPTNSSIKNRAKAITKAQAKGATQEKTCAPMSRSPWSNRRPSSGKKPAFSSRKIRRLSSFAADHKAKEDGRKLVVEKIAGPAVACIPLRLVFSRLNEALNSLVRPAN